MSVVLHGIADGRELEHYRLVAVGWQTRTIPLNLKRHLIIPIWRGKMDRHYCSHYLGATQLIVLG